ncbi:MAG: NYN domain-containing protein [Gammaproteobacteria bacterium]|nr:NYN domain-containing protein [Gammaproteobacteria bacterium]
MQRVIVYVDGFNLYYGLKSKGWRRYYWLDLRRLAENLLLPNQRLVAMRYFTARISGLAAGTAKVKRQATFLEALETLPDLYIYYGHYLAKTRQCFKCGATWNAHEEKMTDVNIAVEMLGDAHDNAFDTAMIVSGDSDLTPPVCAIRNGYPDKRVVIAFPPDRNSVQLRKAATAALRIGRKTFKDSQFPESVPKQDGFILRRPVEWN